ncbi:hypothetical protein OPV22_015469 [Ensete ventricosum]|uniref:TF-B3 domain-containing protein n=1 Tax=Ensete ventricosum TaxID=4639 RepID=A0AAV8PM55_ENSVE|nr:hypothetical protein OPV22_015469 [Ensete ventricosum]
MFEKLLTPSDVGKLNRLVIPKQHAERYFPLDGDSTERGLLLSFEDESGRVWWFRYSYWTSSQSYVLTKGWSRFVKEKKLDAGDVVLFERPRFVGRDHFYIACRRQSPPPAHAITVPDGAEPPNPVYHAAACSDPASNSVRQECLLHEGKLWYTAQYRGITKTTTRNSLVASMYRRAEERSNAERDETIETLRRKFGLRAGAGATAYDLSLMVLARKCFELSAIGIYVSAISSFASCHDSHPDTACDYTFGRWVWDEGRRLDAYTEDCPFLDPGFQCRRNGRNDSSYLYWRWQPHGCDLPRFNATEMLERSRNGKIIFAGDSIGRNQWESFLCMLAKGVQNKSSIYEKYGNPITKHKGFLSMVFHDYNLTVEYYRAPFLAAVGRPPPASPDHVRAAIHLDALHWLCKHWVDADLLVLNAGHWWNDKKTIAAGLYFQVGEEIQTTMDVKEAFRLTLETVKLWTFNNLHLQKSHVFFRNHSPIHFRQAISLGSATKIAEIKAHDMN